MSEWTVNTLKEYVEARLDANRTAVDAAFRSAEKALDKAEAAAEKRFESINEFRGQLSDQARSFLPRGEYEVNHAALHEKLDTGLRDLSKRIDMLSEAKATVEGKAVGHTELWAWIVGAIGVVILIITFIMKDRA
jgi:hypothetical protein